MAHLGNILPPSSDQLRATEQLVSISEKPIKELLFAYFKLFNGARGPRYERYREITKNVIDFEKLSKEYADKDSFYYLPPVGPGVEEEVCVQGNETTALWEKWEFQPVIVPATRLWDESKTIASLIEPERMRVNKAVGEILHNVQISWLVIANRCSEMKGLGLEVCSDNLTLKLTDNGRASKADQMTVRIGVNITIKDKIEINN